MSSRTFIPCRVCGASHTNPMSSSICEPCGISERQKNQAERRQEARMSDDLVKRLRDDSGDWLTDLAADRIEELETEVKALQRREIDANRAAMKHLRDLEQERINSKNYAEFNHIWRKRCEEMEAKLAVCEKYRDAYAECDRIGTQSVRELEAKLAKAVEALGGVMMHMPDYADTVWIDARTTLAELTGGEDGNSTERR